MAYRVRTTFTRASTESEWPFWATELNGSSYETAGNAFLSWLNGRDEATMTFDGTEDGLTVYCDITFADEDTYNAYNAALSLEGLSNQFEDSAFTDYLTANNMTVSTQSGNV